MSTTATMRNYPVYDAGDELPDNYKELLHHYVLNHPEVITLPAFRKEMQEFVTRMLELAPDASGMLRIAMYYADEMRHGWIFYNVYRTLGLTDFEKLDGFFKIEALRVSNIKTWVDLALYNCLTDRAGVYQAEQWIGCSYLPLSRAAVQVAKDERGHANMGYIHLKEAIERGQLAEAQEALNFWWPITLDMFGNTHSKRQHKYLEVGLRTRTNEELRQDFMNEVKPLLEDLGLATPPDELNRRFV